jgi:hypothetical protein
VAWRQIYHVASLRSRFAQVWRAAESGPINAFAASPIFVDAHVYFFAMRLGHLVSDPSTRSEMKRKVAQRRDCAMHSTPSRDQKSPNDNSP